MVVKSIKFVGSPNSNRLDGRVNNWAIVTRIDSPPLNPDNGFNTSSCEKLNDVAKNGQYFYVNLFCY